MAAEDSFANVHEKESAAAKRLEQMMEGTLGDLNEEEIKWLKEGMHEQEEEKERLEEELSAMVRELGRVVPKLSQRMIEVLGSLVKEVKRLMKEKAENEVIIDNQNKEIHVLKERIQMLEKKYLHGQL